MCNACIQRFDGELRARTQTLKDKVVKQEKELIQFMQDIANWITEENAEDYPLHNCVEIQNRILGQHMVPTLNEALAYKGVDDPNFDVSENGIVTGKNFEYLDNVIDWLKHMVEFRKWLQDEECLKSLHKINKRKRKHE